MKKFVTVGIGVLVLLGAIVAAPSLFTLSALPEPGRTETFLATRAKHYVSFVEAASKAFHHRPPTGKRVSRRAREFLGQNAVRAMVIMGTTPLTRAGGCIHERQISPRTTLNPIPIARFSGL